MSDGYIVRRGGGSGSVSVSSAFAVIAATYPAGSTCTCTNGTKTLKAKDTGGSFLFLIPEAGVWTVSCTDGVREKRESVQIGVQYQAENVTLTYELVAYDSGKIDPSLGSLSLFGLAVDKDGTIQTTNSNNGNGFAFQNAIKIADFNTLKATFICTAQSSIATYHFVFGLINNKVTSGSVSYFDKYAIRLNPSVGQTTLSASIEGSFDNPLYLCGSGVGQLKISKIWFE